MLEFRHGAIGSNGSQRFFSNHQEGESSRTFKQLLVMAPAQRAMWQP
jgi:hypothetical protein